MSVVSAPSPNDPALMAQKIQTLYANLADDTTEDYKLYHDEMLDKKLIASTPLHDAAAKGETFLAIEIVTLKPSFARKLNGEGLSPMHLALQNHHTKTVRSLLMVDPELVRVKGEHQMTPFHYAVELDDADLLVEFLSFCPEAIDDVNNECQTALHIAVKNQRVKACELIIGWLAKEKKRDIYGFAMLKDINGNTAMHIATSTKQAEVLRLLIPYGDGYAKNLQGQTCLDLVGQHNDELKRLLGGRRDRHEWNQVEYLSRGISGYKTVFTNHFERFFGKAIPINIYLVVTALTLAAIYVAIVSTPRG